MNDNSDGHYHGVGFFLFTIIIMGAMCLGSVV